MSMTRDEIVDLLTLCAGYDQRTVGRADVAAWQLAAGDLPFADAKGAVVRHYTESRERVMPADVRALVKRIRAERIARSVIPAPAAELADDPRAYQRALQESLRQAADGRGVPASDEPRAAITGPRGPQAGSRPPARLGALIGEVRRQLRTARPARESGTEAAP